MVWINRRYTASRSSFMTGARAFEHPLGAPLLPALLTPTHARTLLITSFFAPSSRVERSSPVSTLYPEQSYMTSSMTVHPRFYFTRVTDNDLMPKILIISITLRKLVSKGRKRSDSNMNIMAWIGSRIKLQTKLNSVLIFLVIKILNNIVTIFRYSDVIYSATIIASSYSRSLFPFNVM